MVQGSEPVTQYSHILNIKDMLSLARIKKIMASMYKLTQRIEDSDYLVRNLSYHICFTFLSYFWYGGKPKPLYS